MKLIKYLFTICTAILFVSISGCASMTGEQVPDQVITSRVKAAVFSDPTLKATDINIETYKGVVQLSGFVNSPSVIHRAEAITRTVMGVQSIQNDMRLK